MQIFQNIQNLCLGGRDDRVILLGRAKGDSSSRIPWRTNWKAGGAVLLKVARGYREDEDCC